MKVSTKATSAIVVAALVVVCLIFGLVSQATGEEESNLLVQGSLKLEEVNLNTKIAGNIEQVLVEEGDQVKAGDVIMTIKSTDIEAKKIQAEGALQAAQAQAAMAQNGARSQEVAQAKAAYDYAEKTYNRVKELYDQGAVSGNTYDQTYAQYTAAKETYNMAVEGARSEDKAAAQALVTQAQGAVAEVNSYLEDCRIKAPKDGTITAVNVEVGELVSTGMPLAALRGNDRPYVEVNVKETELSLVKEGASVKVTMPAYADREFTGTVIKISQQPDFATKRATNNNGEFDVLSYAVKVELDDLDVDTYAGMTVVVDFGPIDGQE
ncbi:HlyD family secretion protein [Bacilliculturomica massiliensis]|uniref:HlyD family secretion protein n=1 Tax=Bacilliculturomica massiliensis TaxID=1917867 RepID=UPI0013EF0B5D|nr:efflux RND transporter periplasmic adaptor subunit [Bacilliculturomica massiliensis]